MSVSVTMPRLGESVSEGTVTRWLKKEGERVEADEPLLEVSTDKVDTEIPAPASGVLESIKVAEDETVEVGVELAIISDSAEGGSAQPAEPSQAEEPTAEQPPAEEAAPPEQREEVAAEPDPGRGRERKAPPPPAAPPPAPAQHAAAEPSGDGGGDASYVTPLVRRLA